MTVEKLERVMWRLREATPKGVDVKHNLKLDRAIMLEIGVDPRTIKSNRKALIKLGWLRSEGKTRVRLTNNDLTGEI